MEGSNGTYQDNTYQSYDQQGYDQVATDGSTSEAFYQLIRTGVSEDVATQLDGLVTQGILSSADITDKVASELINLPSDLMSIISNELLSSDVSNLKNKAAYLIGLIKTQKKKLGGMEGDAMGAGDQGGMDGPIDINQLNITFGKHYTMGTSLGPNVNEEAIKRLLSRTGYKLDLSPGQRQYGPPPNWQAEKPGKGCEIFVGGLLRETFEDTLVPMLEECGMIYELRIMTNPNDGVNKGFGFCIFTSPDAAKSAVARLDGKTMGRNRTLKVNVHNPNTRLFVGGVDKSKDREEIIAAIGQVTDGLSDVILKGDTEHPYNKHRGFVFLDFMDHKHASQAIKRLMLPQTFVFGKNLFADWAEPLAEVSDEIMATVKVLYVKGLTSNVSEEILKDRFSPYGMIDSVKKLKDYAFVHFQQREDALQAMNDLNGMRIEDCNIDVTLAKPGNKKRDKPGQGGFGPRGGMMGGRGGPMRGGPMMRGRGGAPGGRGGFGGPSRGGPGRGGMSRGGPRGGGRGGMRPSGPPSYGGYDDYSSGYDPAPASGGYSSGGFGSGGYGGGQSYRAPAPGGMGGRGRGAPRGSPRGGASSYGGHRGRGSSMGNGRGGAPAATRGGMKRPAAPAMSAAPSYGSASSAYGATYESPAMKKTKSYDDWGAAPIAQQPLTQSYAPLGQSAAASSWYTDSY